MVNRLLLRHLCSCESYSVQQNKPDLIHLVVSNSFTKPFDKSRNLSGITLLVYEASCRAFC